jgi:hypothetical protein
MTWTQALCENCWLRDNPGREPVAIKPEFAELERCCKCGADTFSGIYVRVDPATVPYPRKDPV